MRNLLRPYILGWPIIIISMLLAYLIAHKYLGIVIPMYESTAKLKLSDINDGIHNSNLYKDLDVFTGSQKIGTEIEVIKSHEIIKKAVKNADFDCQIYRLNGISKKELYSESPLLIRKEFLSKEILNKTFTLIVNPNKTIEIFDRNNNKIYVGKIGERINLKNSFFTIDLNQDLIRSRKDVKVYDKYEIIFNSEEKLIKDIEHNLDVVATDFNVSVIKISFKSPNPEKAAYFPNALAKAYIEDYIQSKCGAADTAVEFLGNRINEIGDRLSHAEDSILGYRNHRGITNLQQETETDLRKVAQLKIQKSNLKMNLDAIRDMERYIDSKKGNIADLALNSDDFTDLLSTEMIKKIKQLQSEKKDLQVIYTDNDERVRNVDEKIKDVSKYMVESIHNTRKNQELKYNQLCREIIDAESVFATVPEKDLSMKILNRESDIYQQSYNFLNQKKIEAEIAKTAKIAFHRLITPASVSIDPLWPNELIIKIISLILGFLIAIAIIFFYNMIKCTVDNTDKIETRSNVPILSFIPKLKSQEEIENFFFKLWTQWEIKNIVKPQGIISINGFRTIEGSKFISQNLINTFNIQKKTTLVIDFHSILFPHIRYSFTPLRVNDNISVINIDKELCKTNSSAAIQKIVHDNRGKFDEIIVLNDNIDGQYALPIMSIADLNIMSLDAKLTPVNKIDSVDVIAEEYNIKNMYYTLNRVDYHTSIMRDIYNWFKKSVLKK